MAISVYRSYLPPLNFMLPMVTGRYYDSLLYSDATLSTVAFSSFAMGNLFAIPNVVTVTSVGIEVTGGTSGSLRFGIYTMGNDGFPDMLVLDTGQGAQTGNIGFASVSISQKLNPSWYWVFASSSATSVGGIRQSTTGVLHSESGADLSSLAGTAFLGISITGGNPNLYNVGFPKTWIHLNSISASGQVRSDTGVGYWRIMIGV